MILEIDFKLLEDTQLSADEYSALYLLYRKGYNYYNKLNLNINWEKLEDQGWMTGYVRSYDNFLNYIVTDQFKSLFSNNFDNMFTELIEKYPMKVSTRNGTRILHAADPNAKSNLKAKNRYRKVVGKKAHIHEKILLLLDKQLSVENTAYLQNLETWINNHTWEKYENIDCNANKGEPQRTTRSL